VAKILLILALFFAFCWFPYSLLSLILDLQSNDPQPTLEMESEMEAETVDTFEVVYRFAVLLGHVNSAVNPCIYFIMSGSLNYRFI